MSDDFSEIRPKSVPLSHSAPAPKTSEPAQTSKRITGALVVIIAVAVAIIDEEPVAPEPEEPEEEKAQEPEEPEPVKPPPKPKTWKAPKDPPKAPKEPPAGPAWLEPHSFIESVVPAAPSGAGTSTGPEGREA